MDVKIYCGDAKRLPNGYDVMGNRFRCLQRGFGIGSLLEKKARENGTSKAKNMRETKERKKSLLYCGPKEGGVPAGYSNVGSRYQCLKKGVGAGIFAEYKRYRKTRVNSPVRWDDGRGDSSDDSDEGGDSDDEGGDERWDRGDRKERKNNMKKRSIKRSIKRKSVKRKTSKKSKKRSNKKNTRKSKKRSKSKRKSTRRYSRYIRLSRGQVKRVCRRKR